METAGVRISMDGKGRALDNVFTERFWWTLKYEEVYLHDYENGAEAFRRIAQYMHHYNHHRRHSSLGKKTPADVYLSNGEKKRIVNSSCILDAEGRCRVLSL